MKQELSVEIAADRPDVWRALERDLSMRGEHVTIVDNQAPKSLQLRVRASRGEMLALGYRLERLGEGRTLVVATIEPSGPLYLCKRVVSLGAVEQGYRRLLDAGLENLHQHFEFAPESAAEPD